MARPDRRRVLLDAGLELLEELRFQDLIGGLDVRAVADRAGVTQGSFFHHFPSRAHFAEAVAEHFVERLIDDHGTATADLRALAHNDAHALARARSSIEGAWPRQQDARGSAARALLWASRGAPVSERSARTSGELLAAALDGRRALVLDALRQVLASLGREPLPPFTADELELVYSGLLDGLELRATSRDGDAVPGRFVVDAAVTVLAAITRPRAEQHDLSRVEAELLPVDDTPTDDDEARWDGIVDAAAPLFDGQLPARVSVADVAAAAGVSARTVHRIFGDVRAVAAATFVRRVPALEALSSSPLAADESRLQRIEAVLTALAEAALGNPGVTEALLSQFIHEVVRDGPRPVPGSLRTRVDLDALVTPHARALRADGALRRGIDSRTLAATLVNHVLVRTVTTVEDSAERIVDDVTGLVLHGALA